MVFKLNLTGKSFSTPFQTAVVIQVLYLSALAILFIVVFKTGFGKISSQKTSINDLKKTENILTEKQSELTKAQSDYLKYLSPSGTALPGKNPVLPALVQIKNAASSLLLPVEELKMIGPGSQSDQQSVGYSLKVTGELPQILAYFEAIKNLAPLSVIEKIEISGLGELVSADIKVNSYWKDYPEKIPSLTDPIKKLTTKDIGLLDKISKLTPPSFSVVSPTGPYQRTTPFN
jgi:Tfp pilus assembly protein PilO